MQTVAAQVEFGHTMVEGDGSPVARDQGDAPQRPCRGGLRHVDVVQRSAAARRGVVVDFAILLCAEEQEETLMNN